MYQLRQAVVFVLFVAVAMCLRAQEKQTPKSKPTATKDVDPLALDVLKAVTQPIEQAQTFTFRALVSEEQLASNGQIVTFFHTVDVTVQRPDKVHLVFKGRGEQVDFYQTKGSITMYASDSKLYAVVPAKDTIEENASELASKGIDVPIAPFLNRHLFDLVANNVITGYVIGRVKIYDQDAHQLAFTAPDADWQLWAIGGEAPRMVRSEVINKKLEGKPRTIVQFLDWNLSPTVSADEFTFNKPADAHQIDLLPTSGGK